MYYIIYEYNKNEYNFLSAIIKEKIDEVIKKKNKRSNLWNELIDKLRNDMINTINVYEKYSTEYGYEKFFKENIQEIKNDSFNKFITLFKKEIINEDHDIKRYLISRFEKSNFIFQSLYNSKENIINKNIKDTQNIVELISKVRLSSKVFKDIEKDIKVI